MHNSVICVHDIDSDINRALYLQERPTHLRRPRSSQTSAVVQANPEEAQPNQPGAILQNKGKSVTFCRESGISHSFCNILVEILHAG